MKANDCDPVKVNFTNNSTPSTGLTYAWNFGNGTTSTLANPPAVNYTAQANGKDSTYTITLTVTNACNTNTQTQTITVRPAKPVVAINPNKTLTCAPFNLVLQNLSPGTNISYTYYLTDASGSIIATSVKTDKTDQQFAIADPGTYKVYMIGQNQCGTAQTTTYTIVLTPTTAFPRLTVNGNEGTGCAPLTVTFHNNSTGTTSYRYEWGDGTAPLIATNSNDVTHTFLKGGTYIVKLFASNGCTIDAPAAPVTINVLFQPLPAFTANNTTGCKNLTVQFNNTTTDPASSQVADLTYDWDFGDGSAHSTAINPSHSYTYKNSPYTVTLTATNKSGCSNIITQSGFIVVNGSSLTDFIAKPDSVISIPDYKFNFADQTTNNPKTWKWDFGDGSSSISQNPSHTYADTGLYKVTLTTANAFCDSTKSHYVRIIGVPGQVYIPNAFMPNSITPALRTFILKGSGLKTWSFQIYNNYGQMVFQSNKLSEKGEPVEAWDGTFNGVPVQQGTYVWQATGTFINGNEWKGMSYNGSPPKHTGIIYLIR